MSLPTDRDERNALPVWDGCIAYFPDCWAEIAKVSVLGNKQHGLGAKLHFARDISTDHWNKVMRHGLDHEAGNIFDADGTYHLAKAAWRARAALQVAIESQTGVIALSAVNSADLPKEADNGQTDSKDPQRYTRKELRAAEPQVSDRGQKPRPERPFPSQPERDNLREGDGESQGPQQVPKYGI